MFGKKNDILPFENIGPVEGFCRKFNASLFAFASSNKKRPNSIIFGKIICTFAANQVHIHRSLGTDIFKDYLIGDDKQLRKNGMTFSHLKYGKIQISFAYCLLLPIMELSVKF